MYTKTDFSGLTLIRITDGPDTIYNKISNEDLKSVYPDIFFNHDFPESDYVDNTLFEEVSALLRSLGSTGVVIYSGSESFSNKLTTILSGYMENHSAPYSFTYIQEVNALSEDLKLSHTMKKYLMDHMIFADIRGDYIPKLIEDIRSNNFLPVANKNEGKKIYELIIRQILG